MKAALKRVGWGLLVLASQGLLAQEAPLRVGAGRVDITPAVTELTGLYQGINDPIYSRAIVIEGGDTRAALVTVDAGGIPTPLWQEVSGRLAAELSIAPEHLILSATHTHSAPRQQGPAYVEKIVQSVREAVAELQPARMAWGTGVSYININRTMINPDTGLWDEGPNYEGPSDKTVAVLAFETPQGDPIAVYYNYAVHGVISGQLDEVSGDIPGAASRYLEESLGDEVVAVWSLGAAGDQNPVYFQQTYDLRQIRIDDYAARGEDISNSMPPGGMGLDRDNPRVQTLMNQQRQMQVSMGQMLGEEVLHVLRASLERPLTTASISGVQNTVTCPGRRRLDSGREGSAGTYEPGPEVNLALSMLRIGDVYLGGVNAEVFNPIAQRFKQESPHKHSMMVTLANGTANSGYVPHDAAFGYHTFEVLNSRLQPGCAENAIVNGLLELLEAQP